MTPQADSIERFYSLDAMRGLAALSVVFWHWQHFFFTGTSSGEIDLARLPLHDWLFVFYAKGWLGVDFFFCLSGFVFYWLYSTRVASGAISAWNFAILRFSRLYPLHFASLLLVALGQFWSYEATGSYFVNAYNDPRHFLLNLAFASSWGLEQGHSFNAPVWSVSVEVLLYALFFLACRKLPVQAAALALMSVAGFVFAHKVYQPLGQGIGSFFAGGCVYLAFRAIRASRYAGVLTGGLTVILAGAWAATVVVVWRGADLRIPALDGVPILGRFDSLLQWALPRMLFYWPVLVLFPLTILALALLEARRGPLLKPLSFLGDISYSAYLLHFPLQLLLYVIVAKFARGSAIYYSPWTMLAYFGVLVGIGMTCYRCFEMPVQARLRRACLA